MAALEREPADQGAFLDQACFQDGAVKLSSGEVTLAADSICQACDCSDAYDPVPVEESMFQRQIGLNCKLDLMEAEAEFTPLTR